MNEDNNNPALRIEDLTKEFISPENERHVVIDVPFFEMAQKEQVVLRGSSGSGKTTFLHLIAGILKPESGRISVGGDEVSSHTESERDRLRATHIGYVFQTFNLLQGYTALENILLSMYFANGARLDAARNLLDRVGLKSRMNYYPRQLSVGQQQRVAVARALANRPGLVLADEPTGNLDPANARAAMSLIQEMCRENDAALLCVTHDPSRSGHFSRLVDIETLNRAGVSGKAVLL